MPTIVVDCDYNARDKILAVLKHMQHLSDNDLKRTIRIGGDEKVFDGNVSSIMALSVDGIADTTPYVPVTPNRNNSTTPVTTPTPVTSSHSTVPDGNVDPDLIASVEKEMGEYVNGELLFTGFDITRDLRKTIRCKHADVRKAVEKVWKDNYANNDKADYMRTITAIYDSVKDTTFTAYVYHPSSFDPNHYDAQDFVG